MLMNKIGSMGIEDSSQGADYSGVVLRAGNMNPGFGGMFGQSSGGAAMSISSNPFRQNIMGGAGPADDETGADKAVEGDEEEDGNFEEDMEEEGEEEESFDINDRISDLMAYSGSNVLDMNTSSPGTSESRSQSQGEEESQNQQLTSCIKVEKSPENLPTNSFSPMMSFKAEDSPEMDLSFKDNVLKTLSGRLLKTGVSFVLVSSMKSTKEEVEEALQKLQTEKLVSCCGSAWTVTQKGDQYLQEKGISGPAKDIQPNVRRGDMNIYHAAKKGTGRGVPLNPLELMGSNTRFGVTGTGRGADLARITADVRSVTKPELPATQVSLTSLTPDSIIRKQGRGQQFGPGLITKPGGLAAQQGINKQMPFSSFQGISAQGTVGVGYMSSIFGQTQTQTFSFGRGAQMSGLASLPSPSQPVQRSLPLSPLELIQRERMQSASPQSVSLGGTPVSVQYRGMSPAGPQSFPAQPSGGAQHLSAVTSGLNSLPAGSLEITTEAFAGVNKNPVSALMEYAQSRGTVATVEVLSQRGPSHKPKFVLAAFVGRRQFPGVECSNKNEGKKQAVDVAMRILLAEGHKNGKAISQSLEQPSASVS